MRRAYILQVLIALDQLANALLAGWADETLSSRAHRLGQPFGAKRRWRVARRVINALFAWQADHCQDAYIAERQRAQMPPELRT